MWDITGDTFPTAPNPVFVPPDVTLSPELPDYESAAASGGTSVPVQVSQGLSNLPSGLSGVLQPVQATAEALLKTWGIFNGVKQGAAQQKLQQEISRSEIATRASSVQGEAQLKSIQSAAAVKIAELQAQTAIEKARQESEAAKNGGVVYVAGQGGMSVTTILGFAALGFAVYKMLRGKK
jgi:hypothetical protein